MTQLNKILHSRMKKRVKAIRDEFILESIFGKRVYSERLGRDVRVRTSMDQYLAGEKITRPKRD